MWSGFVSDIPQGWLLCDGTNGTPNLQDRFVLGTTNDGEIGDTGGNSSITLTENQLAPHTHQGITNAAGSHNHGGTTGEDGAHSHEYLLREAQEFELFNLSDDLWNYSAAAAQIEETSTVGPHSHTIASDGSHTHGFTTSPAGRMSSK